MNQMEHRLINQDELQWFNSEGTVDTSPITIGDKPYRLRSYDDNAGAFNPKYMKATHCVPYRCDSEPELELELDVSSLKFQHHPLFSSEHVLAAQLTSLYDLYATLALSGDQSPPTLEQRQKADAQTDSLKAVVEKMKRVWEDMEQLRRTQRYTSTAVTLKFRRYKLKESDGERENVPPQEAPAEEELFSEEVELRRLLQQVEWMEYERKLHLWHQRKRLKIFTQFHSIVIFNSRGDGADGEEAETEADKPEPPADIVESEIADLVRRRIREAERGDRALGEEFTVVWGQIFALRILQFPRTISLEVYETRGVLSQKLADVLVPIPEAEQTTSNTHLAAIHFASDKTVSAPHAGVGCGVRLEVGRGGPLWLSLSGELTCSLAWADSAAGRNVVIRTGTAMNAR
ncbi:hypothetical protein MTO96_012229 [Rhipicephalus appendiculatus]